jgi:hypothetical protein
LVGGNLKEGTKNKFELEEDYRKLLNKKDLFDKQILKLVKHGELSIGVVEIKEPKEAYQDKYSKRSLPHRGKHTS